MSKKDLICEDGIVIGDTTPWTINFFSDYGNSIPLDIKGATVTFTIRTGNAEADTVIFEKVATLGDPDSEGKITYATFQFVDADWTGITNDNAGIYPYDIEIDLASEKSTVLYGNVELLPQQTR